MKNQNLIERIKTEMQARYGTAPDRVRIVRSPYRVCPIGAHIDHQLGPVTAMALDRAVHLAYSPSETPDVRLTNLDFEGEIRLSLEDIPPNGTATGAITRAEPYRRFNSATPSPGASSASPPAGWPRAGSAPLPPSASPTSLAFEDTNGLAPQDNIELDRRIENGYLGLRNDILDQSAILLSRMDCLTLIHCKKVVHSLIPKAESMPTFTLLVAFSGLEQTLVFAGYNRRVEEYDRSVVTPEEYAAHRSKLSTSCPPRRTLLQRIGTGPLGRTSLAAGQPGHLRTPHVRIRPQFHPELRMRQQPPHRPLHHPHPYRGCCVALVDPDAVGPALDPIRKTYATKHPDLAQNAPVFSCQPEHEARIL